MRIYRESGSSGRLRRLSLTVGATLVCMLGVPGGYGFAAAPEITHEHVVSTSQGIMFCRIVVDSVDEQVITDRVFFDREGNAQRSMSTVSRTLTYTAENGKAVIIRSDGQDVSTPDVVDEAAGTLTYTVTNTGLRQLIKSADGAVIALAAGSISTTFVWDLVTGELISSETVVKGPNPDIDSTLCDEIRAALS